MAKGAKANKATGAARKPAAGKTRTLLIEPVSRVEGHARVTVETDTAGRVKGARFHVEEFRGFERFCEGRMFWEMPLIVGRICGICPTSHHLASVKTCDDLLELEIPPTAKMLRELMLLGEVISSHAIHWFYLAAPDFLIPDAAPAERSLIGLAKRQPEMVGRAVELRHMAQRIVTEVGGHPVQPVTAIPGGMSQPLSPAARHRLLKATEGIIEHGVFGLEIAKKAVLEAGERFSGVPARPTAFMALSQSRAFAMYDGDLTVIGADGVETDGFPPSEYFDHIAEHVEPWTYVKFPFLKKAGFPGGVFRCGPLARLNVANRIDTERASRELLEFKELVPGHPVQGTIYYHYARLIEVVYAAERIRALLEDDRIVDGEVRVRATRQEGEGIGLVEAPRGVLLHRYRANKSGKLEGVTLMVATVHNNAAINADVREVAQRRGVAPSLADEAATEIEMIVRCYDPCLSCATHMLEMVPARSRRAPRAPETEKP